MDTDRIKLGLPLRFSGTLLVPLERREAHVTASRTGLYAFGWKEPVALVIKDSSQARAFALDGAEIELKRLVREVPGLEELLTAGSN